MLPPVQLPKFLQTVGSGTMSWDSCFNSRKPAYKYKLGQTIRRGTSHPTNSKCIHSKYDQPRLCYYFKVTLDPTIVLRLWISVNKVNSKAGIHKVQVVIGAGACYLFQEGFIHLVIHCQRLMHIRPYKGSVKLAKTSNQMQIMFVQEHCTFLLLWTGPTEPINKSFC